MAGPIHAYSLLINHYIDDNVDEFATHTVKFASFEPLASAERLSTVSSPYMVLFISFTVAAIQCMQTLNFKQYSTVKPHIFMI